MKGKDSVAQASNFLNMEALAVEAAAMAVTVEVLKQAAVEVLVVAATVLMVETMMRVVKVVLVVAVAMAAKAATVAILSTQAVDQVAAEDMV